ncbi:hypothetical protein AAFF_G00327160 [Aldrovandia affinis]|uniref:Uncharacterized protein n=1 Tax=Aldrovandia affinis TaxID=143900 RepID=A0AAD7TAK9_9TELE|nr:hypothetical protein AAFF_G00327160 [Aldrovandia affinis]
MSAKRHESYTYDFCDVTHPAELLEALREFYVNGLFTDITLQCATGQAFRCHKAVLSARSSYFKVMFTADMRERSNSLIKLTGIDAESLSALVDYVYTAQVSITQANVQSLLEAADLLQFDSVKEACEDFLVRFLDIDNCLGMHSFAELHLCPALEREARRMMLCRFEELTVQEEFLEVDFEKLSSILSTENLNAWKKEVLLEAVVKWVAHDTSARLNCVRDLLHSIQLDLDEVYFRDVLKVQGQHLRGREKKVRSLILPALKSSGKDISASCRKLTSSMYIIGGYYWHPLSEVHMWDPVTNTWANGKDMPDHTRESYSVSLLGPNIYITGGYRTDTIEALDAVWIYCSESDKWAEGCPMLNARYYHCSVALHGCIYAIGGYRGGAPTQETEFYDPLKRKWIPVANMIQGVGNATACVLRDTIYVTGGHYGYRGSCTYEKIQTYRVDLNEWSIATVSPHPEYGMCSVPLNNKLYLVGGQTTITDCYDPERDEWRQMSVMKERRMECGARVMNGCIYVTGGYSYSKGTYLQSIEKYDPELDTWEIFEKEWKIRYFTMAEIQEFTPLEKKVVDQIEYYFGDHNLPRDKFLKEQLQLDDGWVTLETMIKFNRLKCLTTDFNIIIDSLKKSKTGLLEISEDKTKIRRSLDKPLPEVNDEYKDALKHKSAYIKGFPTETTLDEIQEWLNGKGKIESIQMRRNLQKSFKGSIFLVLDSEESAKQFVARPDLKSFKDNEMIVLLKDAYVTKKIEERKQFRADAKAKAKHEKEEKQKRAEDEEMKSLDEQMGCLLKFSGDLAQTSREDFHELFSGHGQIKWIDFARGAKEGTILFKCNAKEALDKAKEANAGDLKINGKDVKWEVLEGDVEKETLKKIIEDQQESLNKRKGKGGRKPGGRGRGGRRERGGRDAGKVQYQGKKTTFDSDDDDDDATLTPKKRALEEGNGNDAGEPAAKQVKNENGSEK